MGFSIIPVLASLSAFSLLCIQRSIGWWYYLPLVYLAFAKWKDLVIQSILYVGLKILKF